MASGVVYTKPKPYWSEDVLSQETALDRAIAQIEKRYMEPTDVWGYSWGFNALDKLTGGIKWEGVRELSVVAARANTGKSAFCTEVGLNAAQYFLDNCPGLEVRIILLEMEPEQCLKRLISQIADVPIRTLDTGRMEHYEYKRVQAARAKLRDLPIKYLRGTHNITTIQDFVKYQDKRYCGLWLLDHIGIIPADNLADNPTWSLGRVSKALLTLSRDHAPGIVLAQLNRAGYLRKDPTPIVSDIYGSDQIVQNADNVFLLDRPELRVDRNEKERPATEVAYIHAAKIRDGDAGGKVALAFTPSRAMWHDLPDEILKEIA